jgi:hypothetical protein
MGAVIVGFALWSLYDGAIKYPHQRERALAMEKLEAEGRGDEWDAFATERGWSTEYPGEPKTEVDIKMQYAMAALAGSIGLPMLLLALNSRRHWIEASPKGITSSWGESFDFDQVERVDKRKWRKKGIAKVTYHDGRRKRRFVLDDYKFERDTMDAILYELEQRIDPEKIVGGPPEPPPGQPHDELEAAAAHDSPPAG